MEGYDISEARSLAVKVLKAYRDGNYDEALRLLEIAVKALDRAGKVEPKPQSICKTNVMINSTPEIEDFVPLGVTLQFT